jgi:hypothetical protein
MADGLGPRQVHLDLGLDELPGARDGLGPVRATQSRRGRRRDEHVVSKDMLHRDAPSSRTARWFT